MATFVVDAKAAPATLLRRFASLTAARRQQFITLQRRYLSALLKGTGTNTLSAVMPVRTGRLKTSIRLYLRNDEVRIRAIFYVWTNQRARAQVKQWAAVTLPALVRQAAGLAAASLPSA